MLLALKSLMQKDAPAREGSRRRSCWRLLWAAVLLLHAPITINSLTPLWRADLAHINWSSLILLGLSNLFFVGEIAFAYSLHILTDRKRVIAFVVVIAILHGGLIERGMPQLLRDADLQYLMLVTVPVAFTWRRWLGRLVAACHRFARLIRLDALRLSALWHAARLQPAVRPRATFCPICAPPRAPPAQPI